MTTLPLIPPPGHVWRVLLNRAGETCRTCGLVLPYLTRAEGPHDTTYAHAPVVIALRMVMTMIDESSVSVSGLTFPPGSRLYVVDPEDVVLVLREDGTWEVEASTTMRNLNTVSRSLLKRMVEDQEGKMKTGRYVVDVRGGQIVSVSIVSQPVTSKHVNGDVVHRD